MNYFFGIRRTADGRRLLSWIFPARSRSWHRARARESTGNYGRHRLSSQERFTGDYDLHQTPAVTRTNGTSLYENSSSDTALCKIDNAICRYTNYGASWLCYSRGCGLRKLCSRVLSPLYRQQRKRNLSSSCHIFRDLSVSITSGYNFAQIESVLYQCKMKYFSIHSHSFSKNLEKERERGSEVR